MVFHPVVRGPLKTRVEVSHDTQILRVVSPTQEDSSSSGRSPVDSLSGDSSDAGSTTAPGTKRVVRRHKKIVKKENQKKNGEENSIAAPSNVPKEDAKPSTSSGDKVYSDSSSDDESAPTRLSPPRSRRRRKLPPGKPGETSNREASVENNEPQGPKIVGILKKPRGGSSTVAFANTTDGRKETRAPENVQSCASSTASSAFASELTRLREDASGAIGRAQVSRDTISLSSASTTKRVRFSDTLESSLNCSQASISHHPPTPSSSSNTDLVLERLWRQILQSGSPTNIPLNGMFNPRMKISLSQKGKGSQKEAQVTCDHITVHVPQAKTLPGENDRVSRPSLSVSGSRQTENTGSRDERKEHTQASFSSAQRQRTGIGSSIESATTQGLVATSKGESGERVRSIETGPTDEEIDRGWGNIQGQLQSWTGGVPVAPQVFQFPPVPPKIEPPAAGGRGGGGRYLPHRPQQKPTTTRSHTHQKWAGPDKQLHRWPHDMTHPDTVQSEPSYVTVQTSSWEQQHTKQTKPGATGLSHEEQQLIQSLQKINQRLKEHEMAHGPHSSSHPPHYHPVSVHTRRRTNNPTRQS
ncbi:hypothetical protein GBAR_LOCUS26838 [Geodia barretti]|nr:hypothetical protein GBAR_LOCUS26838 [Geodia barretti]